MRDRFVRGATIALLLMNSGCATAAPQEGLRFQSRAAFAALDSAALARGTGLRPMDGADQHRAAMIQMVAYLDSTVGRAAGVKSTKIRWWNAGTRAHPSQGILVDDHQIDVLSRELILQKGDAGVAPEVAKARVIHAVRFLIAHEYAHLLQYATLPLDSVGSPRLHRSIECSADLLGGMMFGRYMDDVALDDSTREIAKLAAAHFANVVGSPDWLDVTAHPTPTHRQTCIELGLDNPTALTLTLLHIAPNDSADRAYAERMRRESPDLLGGRTSLTAWSLEKAAQLFGLAAGGSVDAASLSVTRDTTVSTAIARIVGFALRGNNALATLKGGRAPGPEGGNLLTHSLPVPWRCTLAEAQGVPAGVCQFIGSLTGPRAEDVFEATIAAVQAGLSSTEWTSAPIAGESDLSRRFDVRGTPDNPGHAQVDVVRRLMIPRGGPQVQQAAGLTVTITIRAR